MDNKICKRCQVEQPVSNYGFHKSTKDKLNPYCKGCLSRKGLNKFRKVKEEMACPDGMKRCCSCKQDYDLNSDNFGDDKSQKDGFNPTCRKCIKIQAKNYYEKLKTKEKVIPEEKRCPKCKLTKKSTEFYPDKYKKLGIDTYCKECRRPECRKHQREYKKHHYRWKAKFIVVAHYSMGEMCCRHCRQSDIRCLQLDHCEGGGNLHRRSLPNPTGIYSWLIRNDFPEGYQILCANCNFIKKIENKEHIKTNSLEEQDAQAELLKLGVAKDDTPQETPQEPQNGQPPII